MTWPFPQRQPFSVQTEALDRSRGRKCYLWLMEQGLGKTAVALAEYTRMRAAGEVDGLAVLCPNGLKGNWIDEAATLGADVDITAWPWRKGPPQDALVMNYEALTTGGPTAGRGGEALMDLLAKRRMFVMLDESHRIKNPSANVSKFVLKYLLKDATVRRGGTGTPYGNSPMDLYPQLRWAGELNGSNPYAFRNRYARMGGFQGKQVVGINPERSEELQGLIGRCAFRALKSDWTDIPEKLYRSTRVEMPAALAARYKEMEQDFVLMLDDQAVTADMVLTQLLKLQQISSGFVMDGEGRVHQLVPTTLLPKYKTLLDIVDANGSSKTLVFAFYRHTVQQLVEGLTEATGREPAYIRGGMGDEEIRHQKALFNDDAGPGILVGQITAAREGHTLLGGETRRCYTEVFYETTYSQITRSQCEDRAHRFGQRDNLLICDLISSKVEAKAMDALHKHQNVAAALLDRRQ